MWHQFCAMMLRRHLSLVKTGATILSATSFWKVSVIRTLPIFQADDLKKQMLRQYSFKSLIK